jgi:regulator of protease activity HflC (stomatin/prohibitin superfamily)
MIKGVIIVVILVLLGGAILLAATKQKFRTAGIIAAVIAAAALVLIPGSVHTVDTGEIAVVKHLGEARGTRSAGTYFDLWLTNVYQTYDAKVQGVNIGTMTYSSDAQTMDVAMTLQYQIMSDRVVEIAKQYGTLDLLEERIKAIAIEKTKAVLSSHKAMDIIANRASMSPAVEGAIKSAVGEEYHVNIIAVVITNIDFSAAFETAVEEKMIAEQTKLKAEYENQTKIAQTEAAAKAKLIEAEAAAQAKVIEAEADAKANELLEQSLTSKILRKLYLEKWDGVLPKTLAGEEASLLIPAAE